MTTITLRNVKGSALSFTEVDNNFSNLNNDKIEGITSSVDSELALWSSTTGKVLKRATVTGVLKATSGVVAAATAGTDYAKPDTASTWSANQSFNSGNLRLNGSSSGTGTTQLAQELSVEGIEHRLDFSTGHSITPNTWVTVLTTQEPLLDVMY